MEVSLRRPRTSPEGGEDSTTALVSRVLHGDGTFLLLQARPVATILPLLFCVLLALPFLGPSVQPPLSRDLAVTG